MSGEIIKNTVQNIKGKNSFCNTGSRSFLSYFVFKKWMNSRKELEMICEKPNLEFTKILLEKNYQKFKMEYGASKLSNHMSHGLVSLCFLGASKMKLQDFYEKYSKKLEVLPNKLGVSITKENFKDYIGNSESYPDLLQFFTKQIEEEGKKKVIERYLPFISSGMIGAAFHGVIQLGFVLEKEIGDDVQISTGLAYCVTAHNNNLGKLSKTNQKEIPSIDIVVNILKDLGSQKDLLELVHYKDMGFRKRLDIVQHNSSAIEKISKYDIDVKDTPENIQKMMDTIIQVAYMIGVNNFFIIHLVTSMRAIKNIFNFVNKNSIDGKFSLLNNFWRSALLAYVSIGCPPPQFDRAFELKEYDWESVIKDVLRRDTEVHILKLVYVAKEENEESKIRKNGVGEEFYFNFAKNCSKITDWIFYE